MAGEYRVDEYYLQLHELHELPELQPVPDLYTYPYDLHGSTTSAYQLTTGVEGVPPYDPVSMLSTSQDHHYVNHRAPPQNPRKRKSPFSDGYDMSSSGMSMSQASTSMQGPTSVLRTRKTSTYSGRSAYDDDSSDTRSTRTIPDKKQNHSEIEKRRRDKMNTYIAELSSIVPMCGVMARKLDKLTVLRMAVQHVRSIRGALSAGPLTVRPTPTFLSERELNSLVLQAARDSFLMVVGCDRGRLQYVSASVNKILHYDQSELLGQSLFDILHPKDVAKVKEQLSASDLSPRERLIDARTMLPVKSDIVSSASRLGPGARRSFFCRIKTRVFACRKTSNQNANNGREENNPSCKMSKKQAHEKKYCVVQFTGFLKSWGQAEMGEFGTGSTEFNFDDNDASNMSCLVAVGRALADLAPQTSPAVYTRHLQYISRHATDGKFIFVDQRVTLAIGFLPQELLGTSLYEYVSAAEIISVARTHSSALFRRQAMRTAPYCFRRKDGSYARLQTHFKAFKNPWNKDVECLVANNTLITENQDPLPYDDCRDFDIFKQNESASEQPGTGISEADIEIQHLIDSQIGSHRIGSTIAEEVLRRSSTELSTDLPSDLQDVVFNQQTPIVNNIMGVDYPQYNPHVRNNVSLSAAGGANSPIPEPNIFPSGPPLSVSPPLTSLDLDGNGEAAMAVIMSLLEADAGLGGPVNISELPWPLP